MLIPRFETLLCDTDEARDLHYQVRYKVFCEETGFENGDQFPDGRERDDYDNAAKHFTLWDCLQQRWIGAMRLIEAKQARVPSETICRSPLDELDILRNRCVEFSRLGILRDHQRLDHLTDDDVLCSYPINMVETVPISFTEQKNEALLRLLWASFEWGAKNGIDYCYFIVTAPLARMLKRFGIPLTAVGTEVRHRGVRRPYRYNVYEAKEGMANKLPQFVQLVECSRAYVPFSEFERRIHGKVKENWVASQGHRVNYG